MKTALKIATVLTWFNLLLWGYGLIKSLLAVFVTGAFPMLAIFVLLGSIPLNCYAALQLHKSIRHPSIKLSANTPIGIRFVGIVAQFFGFFLIIMGMFILLNTAQTLATLKEQFGKTNEMKDLLSINYLRQVGGIALFLGLCISVNVVLNFRLLRWYYLVKQSDVS